jgi:DHA2 family multidrug resistance protein
MTTLSVSTLRQDEIYQSTGLYSLMRNMGAGIGISVIVALQSHLSQAHQAVLVSHLTPYDPAYRERAAAIAGAVTNQGYSLQSAQMALQALYGSVLKQASLLSFMDCFRWLGIACLATAPLVLLFRKAKAHAGAHFVE